MTQPQIGDPVKVVFLDEEYGSVPTIAYGALGVECDEDGKAVGIVVETDGGATFIRPSDILRIERDD